MWSAIGAGLSFLLGLFRRRKAKEDRAEAEATGAAKQREATQGEAIESQRDQLREAADSRPGDAERDLRSGEF